MYLYLYLQKWQIIKEEFHLNDFINHKHCRCQMGNLNWVVYVKYQITRLRIELKQQVNMYVPCDGYLQTKNKLNFVGN